MKRASLVSLGMLIISTLYVTSGFQLAIFPGFEYTTPYNLKDVFAESYIGHDPINIRNDTDFKSQADSEGWEGNGTLSFPYVIESYTIISGVEYSIQITDVSSYFVIRNCIFTNSFRGSYGVRLENATYGHLFDCEVSKQVYGVYVYESPGLAIDNVTVWDCNDTGLYITYSAGCSITACNVTDSDINIAIDNSPSCEVINNVIYGSLNGPGLGVTYSGLTIVSQNQIYDNSENGVWLTNSDNCILTNNMIYNNTIHGLYSETSDFVEVNANEIWGNGWYPTESLSNGIHTESCDYWTILGNQIWNNTESGVFLMSSEYGNIVSNVVFDNNFTGIFSDHSLSQFISDNIAYRNEIGIYSTDMNARIIDNIVFDNVFGIGMLGSSTCWAHGNDIGWNFDDNAYDVGGFDNNWYMNWYSDFSGQGNYTITQPDVFDMYPSKSLEINSSTPQEYNYGTSGNRIFFPAQALNPKEYEVYVNDNLLYHKTWDGTDIEIDVDGFDVGNYEITVAVYHVSGYSTNATSALYVLAPTTTAPTIPTTTSPITQPPPDGINLIIVVIGGGAIAVVIIIVVLMRRRLSQD